MGTPGNALEDGDVPSRAGVSPAPAVGGFLTAPRVFHREGCWLQLSAVAGASPPPSRPWLSGRLSPWVLAAAPRDRPELSLSVVPEDPEAPRGPGRCPKLCIKLVAVRAPTGPSAFASTAPHLAAKGLGPPGVCRERRARLPHGLPARGTVSRELLPQRQAQDSVGRVAGEGARVAARPPQGKPGRSCCGRLRVAPGTWAACWSSSRTLAGPERATVRVVGKERAIRAAGRRTSRGHE